MKLSKTTIIIFVCLIVLALRLFLAFQTPNFSLDTYFSLRQAESIAHTGFPIYMDDLSFGGRTYIFPPFFQYILGFFTIFLGTTLAAKIIPNLFYTTIPVIVFFASMKLTQSKPFSLISALFSGFIPIIMKTSLKATPQSIFLPIFFLIIYLITNLSEKNTNLVLILMIILVLTSSTTLLLVFVVIIYYIIIKIEGMDLSKKEIEISLFFIFIAFWSTMVIHKKSLFFHGLQIFSQNIPDLLKSTMFAEITFGQAIVSFGMLVLVFGIYGAYLSITTHKSKETLLLISTLLVFFIALILTLIPLEMGLAFMGVSLAIFSSISLKETYEKVKKLKFFLSKYAFFAALAILFIVFSIIPSITLSTDYSKIPTMDEIHAMDWIRTNTPENSTVLATPQEGHLVAFQAKRKNFFDTNFLNIHLINQRYDDLQTLYTSHFETDSIPLLRYYKIDYIYFSPRAQNLFNTTTIPYLDQDCFETKSFAKIQIYDFRCYE